MNNSTPHTIEVLLLAAVVVAEGVLTITAVVAALVLTVVGWRPAPPLPAPFTLTSPELEALPVRVLRQLAREAGLPRCLSARGRRDDLLLALAVAW